MDRLACVIAAGVWDGRRALLKNRDRKYTPTITLVREIIDGVEVAYMRDDVTDWCEGLNEYGIGVANAALAVGLDEAEGDGAKAVEGKKGKKGKSLDGARVLKALACHTVQDAIESLCSHLGGLEGHSFVSDPNKCFSVELVNDDCVIKSLEGNEIHVRTNHGRDTGGTGYTDGEGYLASAARKEKATQVLRQSKTPTDLGPDLMRNRSEGPRNHNDPVRDTDTMATSSQMVLNLTDRELSFYVIPGKMDYEGIEDNLPEDYQPKIKLKVYGYRNGGKELVELSPKTGLRKKKVDPVKLASRVAQRYFSPLPRGSTVCSPIGPLLEAHTMHDPLTPFYQNPDAISREDVQAVFRRLRDLGDGRDRVGIDYNRLADWMSARGGYTVPRTVFQPTEYSTFHDWFLRTPTSETLRDSRKMAEHGDLCAPAEGKIEYTGVVGDGLIELKQGKANVLEALRHIEPSVGDHKFIKMNLYLHDCHRVYAPVGGTVQRIDRFGSNTDPFGRNNVTVIQLGTRFGRVFLCCIGELTIQDFQCNVAVGDTVRAVDEVGCFEWGSMIVVVYPPDLEFVFDESDHPVFIGDPIAVHPDTPGHGEFRYPSVQPVKLARSFTAAVPEKYKHINFKPPQSVADTAEKGLEYRAKASPSNKGGLTPAEASKQGIGSGVQRAVNLKNRDNTSPEVVKQMAAFFSRHEKNKGVSPEHKGEPWNDKGNVSWLIWGGDPGRAWAEKVKGQMEAADVKAMKTADLSPPLGVNGGPCKVVDRINKTIRNLTLRGTLIDDAETGDLSNQDARMVYPLSTESGSAFKSFTLLPHAQFRMDYRSITVADVERSLNTFVAYTQRVLETDPQRYEAIMSQDKIEWVDPKTRLKMVFATDSGRIEVITVFWKGRQDPPPTSCEVPMKSASVHRVVAQHLKHHNLLEVITEELASLEALASDLQTVLDTYAETVPMPVVGRIAAITLHSQTECVAQSEHGMRHAERVIAHCRTYLNEHPSEPTASAAMRDAQMLYERFESFRAQAREMLSALSQKIMPKDLQRITAEAVDTVRAALNYPNALTVTVHPYFAPCKVGNRTVDAMVFNVYLTAYPQPMGGAPEYQQFLLSQATLGDTSVYLTAVDRMNEKAPVKPVKVDAGAGKKILSYLKGWSNVA